MPIYEVKQVRDIDPLHDNQARGYHFIFYSGFTVEFLTNNHFVPPPFLSLLLTMKSETSLFYSIKFLPVTIHFLKKFNSYNLLVL